MSWDHFAIDATIYIFIFAVFGFALGALLYHWTRWEPILYTSIISFSIGGLFVAICAHMEMSKRTILISEHTNTNRNITITVDWTWPLIVLFAAVGLVAILLALRSLRTPRRPDFISIPSQPLQPSPSRHLVSVDRKNLPAIRRNNLPAIGE